ncbi:hypothetical protein D3C85_978680 [compost metagenome]
MHRQLPGGFSDQPEQAVTFDRVFCEAIFVSAIFSGIETTEGAGIVQQGVDIIHLGAFFQPLAPDRQILLDGRAIGVPTHRLRKAALCGFFQQCVPS